MTATTQAGSPAIGAWRLRGRLWRSDEARGLVLVSPTFLYALLLLVTPILVIVVFSFWTQNYLEIDRTPTLANYREVWSDPLYRVRSEEHTSELQSLMRISYAVFC